VPCCASLSAFIFLIQIIALLHKSPLLNIKSKIESGISSRSASNPPESHDTFPKVEEMSRRIEASPYVAK
jgi:hypothetical protein